jgi:hypothetical protein
LRELTINLGIPLRPHITRLVSFCSWSFIFLSPPGAHLALVEVEGQFRELLSCRSIKSSGPRFLH